MVIAAMVILSSLFSFLQEYRSSKAADALRALVHTKASCCAVVSGRRTAAFRRRPCGPRAARAHRSRRHRAALGGQSRSRRRPSARRQGPLRQRGGADRRIAAGGKAADRIAAVPLPLEACNLAFMGTYVASGTATAVVIATGPATYFGGIAHAAGAAHEVTSFDFGIHRYIWLVLRFMLVLVPAVFLINGLTKGDWMEAFVFAIAVAVGLTPEMLPMVITVNLTKGALAMAGKRVIVKRLASIQNLGAMDVLATDKTGTLTQDRVLLERHVDLFGRGVATRARVCVPQQLLPVGNAQSAGRGGADARGAPFGHPVGRGLRQDRRDPVRFRAATHVGGRRYGGRGQALPDLQGCGRGGPRGLQDAPSATASRCPSRRDTRTSCAPVDARAVRRRFPRDRRRLQGAAPGACDVRGVRRVRIDAAGLYRVPRSAQGVGGRCVVVAPRRRRRREGADRRQRGGLPPRLPAGRPARRRRARRHRTSKGSPTPTSATRAEAATASSRG